MIRLFLLVAMLTAFLSGSAQEYKENREVQFILHKIVIPEDGTLDEALALTREWTENVLRKNENFEEIHMFISDSETDTINLLVQYTYAKNTERNTNDINQELIQTHWPEEGSFDTFIAQLHRYINPNLNERSMFNELVLE